MRNLTLYVSLAFICCITFPAPSHAQGRVVVMTKAQNLAMESSRGGVQSSATEDAVAEIVTGALLRQGYRVVDRLTLNAVLREQGFHHSGMVDQSTAARIGRLAGAQAIFIINVHGQTTSHHRGEVGEAIGSLFGGMGGFNPGPMIDPSGTVQEVSMTVKLIDVESAEVVWLGDKSAQSQPDQSVSQTELIRDIVARLNFPPPPAGRSGGRSSRRSFEDENEEEQPRSRKNRDYEETRRPRDRTARAKAPSIDHNLRAVQGRLKELGYYKDKIDGRQNQATREALIRFQNDRKLSMTGIADAATKQRLGLE